MIMMTTNNKIIITAISVGKSSKAYPIEQEGWLTFSTIVFQRLNVVCFCLKKKINLYLAFHKKVQSSKYFETLQTFNTTLIRK